MLVMIVVCMHVAYYYTSTRPSHNSHIVTLSFQSRELYATRLGRYPLNYFAISTEYVGHATLYYITIGTTVHR